MASHYQLFETAAGIAAVADAAIRYFEGERVEFFEAPVALGGQPPFVAQVYAHVRTLGWGETTTYGERAVDTFYVTDLIGDKIDSAARVKSLEKRLLEAAASRSEEAVAA